MLAICTSSMLGLIASHPSRFAASPILAVRTSHLVAQAAAPTALLALPPAGYEGAVAAGEKKASMKPNKIFALGMISGAHIGFGAWLMLAVGGACPGMAATNPGLQNIVKGAFGLPFGLMMTLVTGAELFTGNTALVTAAVLEGKASIKQLVKSWTVSWTGNLVGSVLLAAMVATAGTMGPLGGASVGTAIAKTSLPFKTALFRGILCNWLVCMAVYMASFAKDLPGKMVAIWFPISAFIALGLEHSVANMFIIPLGIMSGAAVSWKTFFLKNLLPVTLGNIIGGAFFVAAAFSFTYGALGKD
jgi:formate/nitrite transporter